MCFNIISEHTAASRKPCKPDQEAPRYFSETRPKVLNKVLEKPMNALEESIKKVTETPKRDSEKNMEIGQTQKFSVSPIQPENGPKNGQEAPERVPEGPQRVLQDLKNAPETLKEVPEASQRISVAPQKVLQTSMKAQEDPKTVPDAAERVPETLKVAEVPEGLPETHKMATEFSVKLQKSPGTPNFVKEEPERCFQVPVPSQDLETLKLIPQAKSPQQQQGNSFYKLHLLELTD